jgi:hypothetical protein
MKQLTVTAWAIVYIMFMASSDASATFPPLPEAIAALTSDAEVTVTEITVPEWEAGSNFYFAFEPTAPGTTIGFIVYPGAYVDPRSYAPFAHEIARAGFATFIVKMINDLAIGPSAQRATRVISDHPGILEWAIGGHSMGAFGGCAYAREHTDTIDGVVLWAGWPSESARLDDKIIKAVSIYGTNDGICTLEEDIEPSKQDLPPYTQFVAIEGGNHTQFGWYDTSPDPVQPGDNAAGISRQGQQDAIVQASVDLLETFALCANDPDNDYDNDTVCGDVDNCPYKPNAGQEDSYPPLGNSCGNACECEGNFNIDVDVDGGDAAIFKADFGRSALGRPCTNAAPCKGDFTCNKDVSGSDAALFKSDFGRNSLNNPCPSCPTNPWCTYP